VAIALPDFWADRNKQKQQKKDSAQRFFIQEYFGSIIASKIVKDFRMRKALTL